MRKTIYVILAAVLLSCMMSTAEAKKARRHKRKPATEEVWTIISGTYPFSDGTYFISIYNFQGDFKARIEGPGFDEDSEFGGNVDEKSGLITIVDDDGKELFTGKMYRGGNQLKGKLKGKPITLEGMGGL